MSRDTPFGAAFLNVKAPNRTPWGEILDGQKPTVDSNNFLSGPWGRAVVAGVRYEMSHPDWSESPNYQDNGPVGQIIDFMQAQGYDGWINNAEELETFTREHIHDEGGLPGGPEDPEVWHVVEAAPEGFHEEIAAVMNDAFWCCVCPLMCGGFGIGSCGDPLFLQGMKCCCVEGATHTTDCCGDEGLCFTFTKCLCCVHHQTVCPGGGPDDGAPFCALCNYRCGGESDAEPETNDMAKLMEDMFMIYYCLCCGTGCSLNFPMIKGESKFCCLKSMCRTASFWPENRGICYVYSKTCCCIEACTLCGGKRDGIPTCAVCGQVCCGEEEVAPKQEEMA
eukprot:gnl/TRDRNA2_/TRDRNA2_188195_c0_seq1.p1 gnl/TRDRNA2_/TRDRNA2_188195_c0~~gnl/TRDRNA2_/TRDRNA2_188195_c0_seq1.p1  ORF type:complete len:336 (-),score=62.64 gnl/TRDRNA2_/TRDRNA2_188195_c0_seq1:120-1127(-)